MQKRIDLADTIEREAKKLKMVYARAALPIRRPTPQAPVHVTKTLLPPWKKFNGYAASARRSCKVFGNLHVNEPKMPKGENYGSENDAGPLVSETLKRVRA